MALNMSGNHCTQISDKNGLYAIEKGKGKFVPVLN
jgi:hypothetical protein